MTELSQEKKIRRALIKLMKEAGYSGAVLILANPSTKEGGINVNQSIIDIPAKEAATLLNMIAGKMWECIQEDESQPANSPGVDGESKILLV